MDNEQKNLDFWLGSKRWALDTACRLVCDADPNNADQTPLQMPDPATRPAWVNLFYHAIDDDEVEIIEGKGGARGVDPAKFIKWARRKGHGQDAKFNVLLANSIPAAKVKNSTGTTLNDETLAALFDPVPVEALEKMFSANGNWKKWVERAKRNGLTDARDGAARFNPFKAGVWFVGKGAEGWDGARLYRTLANNLPARSLDSKHLLTGGID